MLTLQKQKTHKSSRKSKHIPRRKGNPAMGDCVLLALYFCIPLIIPGNLYRLSFRVTDKSFFINRYHIINGYVFLR